MRHGKKDNHLGRTSQHRGALLKNMASSLIIHKRIETTLAKAKELRKFVEPLLTKAKDDNTHSRRIVFSYLQNKDSVKELFDNVADKIAARQGGYTRIIKMDNRLGDNAEMCIMELVDYNMLYSSNDESSSKATRTRRGRKKSTETVSDTKTIGSKISNAKAEVKVKASNVEQNKVEAEDTVSSVNQNISDATVASNDEQNNIESTENESGKNEGAEA
ncbi:MAG: 50S ribosomal protein L17 [Bacteroidota bacterium]|nr:50S ribosomal protein L17 [Bacteroidota bacterium]